ncbi:MAG: DUF3109 family protein [Rikenellaceae bacterium]
MIEIEDKIVSDDVLDCYFSCDYCKCKGICCVEGDSGAPLEVDECGLIEDELEAIKPFMSAEGIEVVEREGVFTIDSDGDFTTTLVNNAECAFTINEDGFILCAIEKAYRAGAIPFNKPISCHLYPIRTVQLKNGFTGLNYHKWDICKDGVIKGKAEGIKLYKALQEPIERAFGKDFFRYLGEVDDLITKGEIEEE